MKIAWIDKSPDERRGTKRSKRCDHKNKGQVNSSHINQVSKYKFNFIFMPIPLFGEIKCVYVKFSHNFDCTFYASPNCTHDTRPGRLSPLKALSFIKTFAYFIQPAQTVFNKTKQRTEQSKRNKLFWLRHFSISLSKTIFRRTQKKIGVSFQVSFARRIYFFLLSVSLRTCKSDH